MSATSDASTLSSEVYSIVRRRILKGDLHPGQPISRRTVAAEVRTSLLPVAEALHRIEFEGLLESRPRAGTRVRIPSREDVKGHFIVREALEVQAAIRVATMASDREREKLVALAERVGRARHAGRSRPVRDRPSWVPSADCRIQPLCGALRGPRAGACLFHAVVFTALRPSPEDSPTLHKDLAEAIASQDPQVAADTVREHVAVGYERSMQILEPYFEMRAASGRTLERRRRRRSRRERETRPLAAASL